MVYSSFIFLVAEVNATIYSRHNFNSICNPKQLTEFVVMDVEPIKYTDKKTFPGQGSISKKVSLLLLYKIFQLVTFNYLHYIFKLII